MRYALGAFCIPTISKLWEKPILSQIFWNFRTIFSSILAVYNNAPENSILTKLKYEAWPTKGQSCV